MSSITFKFDINWMTEEFHEVKVPLTEITYDTLHGNRVYSLSKLLVRNRVTGELEELEVLLRKIRFVLLSNFDIGSRKLELTITFLSFEEDITRLTEELEPYCTVDRIERIRELLTDSLNYIKEEFESVEKRNT